MLSTSNSSIRNVQYQHLIEMLNFNLPEGPNRPVWKLFIMDTAGQRILAPLIKVNDLREHGVTLFLQLKAQRERVPDVPAVYFVEPSSESISMICQDLRNNLYDNYYLNFTSHVSRDALEELAQVALQTQTQLKISKVYDQYLNYITLEDNLFTLEIPKLTSSLIKSTSVDSNIVDTCASGIFSVLMSFGCCAPVICAPNISDSSNSVKSHDLIKGICSKLESRIKNHLINTKSPLSLSNPQASPNQPRPLMLLIDRRIDLAAPLKHSASYNALIDEILGLNSNQIQIPGGKCFDIDRRDWFWRENSIKSFPKVAEAVESALKSYKTEYDRVLQTTPGMTEDLMKNASVTVNGTNMNPSDSALTPEQLKIAINVLPELTERKRLIDTHLQISTALLESIKTRDLGTLFNIEQEIISASLGTSNTVLAPSAILTSLKDPKMGNSQDKLRLFLIYLIYNYKQLSGSGSSFVQEALDVLKLSGDDLKAFQTILNICSASATTASSPQSPLAIPKVSSPINQNSINNPTLTDSSLTTSFGDFFNKISSTTNVLVSSVKSLIPSSGISESPLSKFVDSAYSQVTGKLQTNPQYNQQQQQQLHFIDPRPSKSQNQQQNAHSIDHVIIFIIGGAAYSEYDHLIEHFSKSKTLQNVKYTFGVTEILNPKKFLNQLSSQ